METTGNNANYKSPTEPQEPVVADLSSFPAFKRNHQKEIAPQIAHHLTLLMQQNGTETRLSIRIPAAMILCDFYNCTPLDVLDGLYAFRQKNYEYVMNGMDSEITLHNQPHIVKTRPSSFWNGPWNLTHKIAESPFISIFPGKAG